MRQDDSLSHVPTREDLAFFFDCVHAAINSTPRGEMPVIETSRKIIDHFNRGPAQKGFDAVGYFVYEGVKVFEEGKRQSFEANDRLTSEQKTFGTK